MENKKRRPKYLIMSHKLKTCFKNNFKEGVITLKRVIKPGCILNDNINPSLLWWNMMKSYKCSDLQILMKSNIQEQFREMYLLNLCSF